MIYEVLAHLFFDIEDEANDFYHDCELALKKAITVNPGAANIEHSSIELNHSYHDEDPNLPCTPIATDFSP